MADLTYNGKPLQFHGESFTFTVEFTEEEWSEMQRRSQQATADRVAEMAACPYVACTCGWHEE